MNIALPPLPYALDALEPFMSRHTLAAHHHHHHSGYVDRTRGLVRNTELESATLREVVEASANRQPKLFNASAQAWNHEFFWESMRPGGGGMPSGEIGQRIRRTYGTHSAFIEQFVVAAMDHFASGWAWLALENGTLRISTTANAGVVGLADGTTPLFVLDLWEHAYYLDYEHRRLDYVVAFLGNLVDWDNVNRRLLAAEASQAVKKIAAPITKNTPIPAVMTQSGLPAERC